jgi:hypothetical protein
LAIKEVYKMNDFGAVALRINTTIYCANLRLVEQHTVCKFFSATAPYQTARRV